MTTRLARATTSMWARPRLTMPFAVLSNCRSIFGTMLNDGESHEKYCHGRYLVACCCEKPPCRRLSRRATGPPHLVPDGRTDVEDVEPAAHRHPQCDDRPTCDDTGRAACRAR